MVNVLPISTGLPDYPWAYRTRKNVPQGIFLKNDGDGFAIDFFHSDPETVRRFVCEIREEAQDLVTSRSPRKIASQEETVAS